MAVLPARALQAIRVGGVALRRALFAAGEAVLSGMTFVSTLWTIVNFSVPLETQSRS